MVGFLRALCYADADSYDAAFDAVCCHMPPRRATPLRLLLFISLTPSADAFAILSDYFVVTASFPLLSMIFIIPFHYAIFHFDTPLSFRIIIFCAAYDVFSSLI